MNLKEEILAFNYNGERVKKFLDLGLNPKWGLSAELTILMYQLYSDSSGDNQYNGKYNCSGCQDTIFRKLKDFNAYGDNLGQPLINWEPIVEEPPIEPTPEPKPKRKKN